MTVAGRKRPASKKPATARPRRSAKRGQRVRATARPTARAAPRRGDFGAPVEPFFAKQPPQLRAILEALRTLVEEAAPDATASIKWGIPFFAVAGEMTCALGAHRSHVNLILAGPPDAFADPDGRLEGGGKSGRHLKLRALEEPPRRAVRGWLRTAARFARAKAAGR
jgi:hypothetical protein